MAKLLPLVTYRHGHREVIGTAIVTDDWTVSAEITDKQFEEQIHPELLKSGFSLADFLNDETE